MVLLEGALDDVVIGSHVPNVGFFTEITDVGVASPSSVNAQLGGADHTGLLVPITLGVGLIMTGNVLSLVDTGPGPPGPGSPSNDILREDGSYLCVRTAAESYVNMKGRK